MSPEMVLLVVAAGGYLCWALQLLQNRRLRAQRADLEDALYMHAALATGLPAPDRMAGIGVPVSLDTGHHTIFDADKRLVATIVSQRATVVCHSGATIL